MKQIFPLIVFCFLATFANSQNLSISWPLERSNFQQSSAGQSDLWIAGQYRPVVGTTVQAINDQNINVEARVHTLDNNGNPTGAIGAWTLIHSKPSRGVFRGKLTLGKGWYKLEVRVVKISTSATLETSYINKVGIGDVFVIAGQSNASGFAYDDASLPAAAKEYYSWSSPLDKMNVINRDEAATDFLFPEFTRLEKWSKIAPKGQGSWYWGQTGYLLATGTKNSWEIATNQPVTFFNAARAGTTAENWSKSSLGQPTSTIYGGLDVSDIYNQLRKSLNFYANMFGVRAVLWHQGESDNEGSPWNYYTTQADYQTRLKNVIKQTRLHTGKSIPWAIGRVSYNGNSAGAGHIASNLINAQNSLITADSDPDLQQVVAGMNSDVVDVPRGSAVNAYRPPTSPELTHFTGEGLESAGWTWAEALRANNTTNNVPNTNFYGVYSSAITPIQASPLLSVTVSVSGSSTTLTPETGFVEWKWVSLANNYNYNSTPVYSTTNSATRAFTTTLTGTFRCYVKDANGNLKISQAITLPLPTINSSLRTSAGAEISALEDNWNIDESADLISVYPNPSQEAINLDLRKLNETVKSVLLIDGSGKTIREVGFPAKTLKFEKLPIGIINCIITTDSKVISKKILISR